jgi:hypothetical protein
MVLKKFSTNIMLGLLVFIVVSLYCSAIYSEENPKAGTILPNISVKGPASPQTKSYLGVNNEKQFSILQVKTKLLFVEFFDVY